MNPTPPSGNYPGNYPPNYPGNQPPAGPAPYPQQMQQPYGQQMPPQYAPPQKPFSTKAIVAMVMGGISVFIWPLGPITGLVGSITGFMGMKESKEPHGSHRGYGLALGGLIISALMFFGSLGIYAIMIVAFVMVADQSTLYDQGQRLQADRDLTLIAERLNLYAIENQRSIGPGGPVVNQGWSVSYDENSPKVQGKLQLADLVTELELENMMSQYTLEIISNSQASVRHINTGKTLIVKDAASGDWQIDQGTP